MALRRFWIGGGIFLGASLVHAQLILGGTVLPLAMGSHAVAAAVERGDLMGMSILFIVVLGIAGSIATLIGWSYTFTTGCLGATLLYYILLAPLGIPYLPLMGANLVAWGVVVLGRHEFSDQAGRTRIRAQGGRER